MSDLAEKIRAAKQKTLDKEEQRRQKDAKAYEEAKTAFYKNEDEQVLIFMEQLIAVLSYEAILEPFENGLKQYEFRLWPSIGYTTPGNYHMTTDMIKRFSSPFLSRDYEGDRREPLKRWGSDWFKHNILRTDYPLGAHLKKIIDQGMVIKVDNRYTGGYSRYDDYELPSWTSSVLIIDYPMETS